MDTDTIKKQFVEILELEKNARDIYTDILKNMTNPNVRKVIKSIKDDEMRHIELAERAISILNSE